MSSLTRWYPGDRTLGYFLIVTLAVALLSSAGWVGSRLLRSQPATRHLVLFCALACCLALPPLSLVCNALGLTLISIPFLPMDQAKAESGLAQIAPEPGLSPRQRLSDRPHNVTESKQRQSPELDQHSANSTLLRPHPNEVIGRDVESEAPSVAAEANPTPAAVRTRCPAHERLGAQSHRVSRNRRAGNVDLGCRQLAVAGGSRAELLARRAASPLIAFAAQRLAPDSDARTWAQAGNPSDTTRSRIGEPRSHRSRSASGDRWSSCQQGLSGPSASMSCGTCWCMRSPISSGVIIW